MVVLAAAEEAAEFRAMTTTTLTLSIETPPLDHNMEQQAVAVEMAAQAQAAIKA